MLEEIASSDLPGRPNRSRLPAGGAARGTRRRPSWFDLERPHAARGRSSSLLEDDLDHPFAGVYGTKMIPNNEIEEHARFTRLDEAIKFVVRADLLRRIARLIWLLSAGRPATRKWRSSSRRWSASPPVTAFTPAFPALHARTTTTPPDMPSPRTVS